MPARQPFTSLCQALARRPFVGRADLHVHTSYSDGECSPAQIIDLARRSGLSAVAVTDHDTLDGIAEARAAATGSTVEVVAGVEITAELDGREIHLLGLFVRPEDAALRSALARLSEHRRQRFWDMVGRLRACGVVLDEAALRERFRGGTLGRRNLAAWLVESGRAGSVREAFARYLGEGGRAAVPKLRLPAAEAIALVRGAGGVAAWAHPPYDDLRARLVRLRALGLAAVEIEHPNSGPSQRRSVRALAAELGLEVAGGSDYHGPGHYRRDLGSHGVSTDELARLRRRAAA